ncbi:MAG: ribonuclease P protein component [Defluviicoccus sp.]|nr:ribonuclease P protein component [Defluviicoccus sp.]
MLPTLKKRRDFLRAARNGVKSVTPGLILQVRPNAEAGSDARGGRVGFTVSRKVGNAVARNRARRRLRAAVERVLGERARPGRDYVVIGRRATVTRPFAALVTDLETALRRTEESLSGGGASRRREQDKA